MYKIGIIGERDSVLGFMAIGFSVHEAPDVDTAGELIDALAKSGEYAIIFIVENYAEALSEKINKYKDSPIPAIITVPGAGGATGYGMEAIRSAVERAVGADILGD
ncbi:MAG: V-type ATP synthase subunit F [Clostridia bacterium]|nr:V-type ATP synthase subunit F [Clostridia bacterium]